MWVIFYFDGILWSLNFWCFMSVVFQSLEMNPSLHVCKHSLSLNRWSKNYSNQSQVIVSVATKLSPSYGLCLTFNYVPFVYFRNNLRRWLEGANDENSISFSFVSLGFGSEDKFNTNKYHLWMQTIMLGHYVNCFMSEWKLLQLVDTWFKSIICHAYLYMM